ncbi:MAG: hypothetical protein R2695_20215 [Acidimicrobiales bacterium]
MGDWSMAITLSRCSMPSTRRGGAPVAPSLRGVDPLHERPVQDVVHQRRLPGADTPETHTNLPNGISTSMFSRLFSEPPHDDGSALAEPAVDGTAMLRFPIGTGRGVMDFLFPSSCL